MTIEFVATQIALLTVSDSRTPESDTSGKLLKQRVSDAGHHVHDYHLVPDDKYAIRYQLSAWICQPEVGVIITTGGTGLTGRDGTPEAASALFDKEIVGFGELFRQLSFQVIKTSTVQSRAVAGVANGTFIFCLPGSSGACKMAWDDILVHQLDSRHKPCNFIDLMPRLLEK